MLIFLLEKHLLLLLLSINNITINDQNQDYLVNRKIKTIYLKEIFCNNVRVFTVTFDQIYASFFSLKK